LYGNVQIDESDEKTKLLRELPNQIIEQTEYITDKIARSMDEKISDDVAGNLSSCIFNCFKPVIDFCISYF